MMSMNSFNGGKMNHIWTPGRGCYESTFANEAAERCFHNPKTIVSLKVHGECALLIKTPVTTNNNNNNNNNNDELPPGSLFEWIFATRYDTHGKKDPPKGAIPLPVDSPQPSIYQDHHYWLIPLDKNLILGKGQRRTRVGPETYGAIAAGVASGDIPNANDPNAPPYISVEWIGRKHQGNIDHIVDVDHAIAIHGQVHLNHWLPMPRSREQVHTLATKTLSIEGLVLYDPDTGERFKIRFDMFPNSLFVKHCQTLPTTIETTSIKPKAIVATQRTDWEADE